jgi:cytochrome c oxidase cbb3-type subunit III
VLTRFAMSSRASRFASVLGLLMAGACVDRNGKTPAVDAAPPDAGFAAQSAPKDAALAPTVDAGNAFDPVVLLEKGKILYPRYCEHCHGKTGKGYAADEAPALANDDLLTIASDDYLVDTILRGRPGTTMSAWGLARGGPLGKPEAMALVALFRSWQTRPSDLGATEARVVKGDAARGTGLYLTHCMSCHGLNGRGGKHNALSNPELLATAKDGFLARTIEKGRAGTPMLAYEGKLTAENIGDLVALIRSWQKPIPDPPDLPPSPGALQKVVLNPRGPEPTFDAKADFVKVDVVKAELDRGASMIIADARPPGDYALMHVAGAISVPFYMAKDYAAQIPKDKWVLTYCACPHASSVKLRDALRQLGYTKVAVLDEGINVWRDHGHPVRGGAKP